MKAKERQPNEYVCMCGFSSRSYTSLNKHIRVNGYGKHINIDWLIGHLIVRGDPKHTDEEEK